jgi:type I restriction enzyme, S subunit
MTKWQVTKFGDVVRKVKNKWVREESSIERYVAGGHMDSGNLKIERWGDVNQGYVGPAFNSLFSPGQVLFGSRRTYLKKMAVVDFEGVCSNTTFILESSNLELLLQEYLPILMLNEKFHKFTLLHSKGSVTPYINFSDLAKYEFMLPPVSQQKIAIELFEKFQNSLNLFSNSIYNMDDLFSGMIDHLIHNGTFRGQDLKEITTGIFESSKLTIPAHWELVQLSELVESHKAGIFKPKKLFGAGHNIVGVADLYGVREIDGRIFNQVELTEDEIKEYSLQEGDLIYGESSLVREGIAKVLHTSKSGEGTVFAWHTRKIVIDKTRISPYFLSLVLDSTMCRRFIISRSTTTALTGMTVSGFLETPIPLPPKEEQEEIESIAIQFLDDIDHLSDHKTKLKLFSKFIIKIIGGEEDLL